MSTFNICILLQVIQLGALHCFLNYEERIFQCFHCNNANGFKLDFYTGFSYWILLHQIRIFYFYCSDYVLGKCKWQSFFSLFFPQLFDKLRPLNICCWNPQLQSHLPLHCLCKQYWICLLFRSRSVHRHELYSDRFKWGCQEKEHRPP